MTASDVGCLNAPVGPGKRGADAVLQFLPGDEAVHSFQEHFPTGLALLPLVFDVGKVGWSIWVTLPTAIGSSRYYATSSLTWRQSFLVPAYQIPNGWNRAETDVAFQIAEGYPRQPPYGFYVPSGLLFEGDTPGSYTEPAHNQPPFGGVWGFFSWAPDDWKPATEIGQGTNLLNWVNGFKERFRDGK